MFEDLLPVKAEYRKLAQKDARFTKRIRVSQLSRIVDAVLDGEGVVDVDLSFGFNHKYQVEILGTLKANVKLACQRCLKPMDVPIDAPVKVIVTSEERISEVERSFDPYLAEDDWIDLNDLVQEEFLLALPFVSYHDSEDCQRKESENTNSSSVSEELDGIKKNPFHVLSSLKESNKE